MTNKTRKYIWPPALMSLAVLGVLAMVVALSAAQPQSVQADGCNPSTMTVDEYAGCVRDHQVAELDHTDPSHSHGPPNQPPVVTDTPLADVEIHISTTSDSIDLSTVFTDLDNDTLTYSAMSDAPDTAKAEIVSGVMSIVSGDTRGIVNITVTANDGKGGTVSDTFTVTVVELYTLTARMPAENEPATYLVESSPGGFDATFDLMVEGAGRADVTVTVTVREIGGIDIIDSDGLIGAGFKDEEEIDLEGSLTVKGTDAGSRAFEIEGECLEPGGRAKIEIADKDLEVVAEGEIRCRVEPVKPRPVRTDVSDHFTIASYDDWMFHTATDGYISPGSPGSVGNPHLVNAHPTTVMGWLERDEPVDHPRYTLGVDKTEMLRDMDDGSPRRAKEEPTGMLTREQRVVKNADAEVGQRTVQVLVGAPHVQLTVTSIYEKPGPAYIRFLRSDMTPMDMNDNLPFGTDVDEEPMHRGADVVGLDSQGRLNLNMVVDLTSEMALAYDQYDIITPGYLPGERPRNSYLTGRADTYNQGTFRFFDPCPEKLGAGHHFHVEVYEQNGKYLETRETVVCINPPGITPSELAVTTFTDLPGQARLQWTAARGATAHYVIVLDMSNPAAPVPVPGSYERLEAPVTVANITGLEEDVKYRFAVAAARLDAAGRVSYSMPAFIDQIMDWEE